MIITKKYIVLSFINPKEIELKRTEESKFFIFLLFSKRINTESLFQYAIYTHTHILLELTAKAKQLLPFIDCKFIYIYILIK